MNNLNLTDNLITPPRIKNKLSVDNFKIIDVGEGTKN